MTPLPPALPHGLSYLTFPVSGLVLLPPSLVVLGSNGLNVRCSSPGHPAADIPPWRLVELFDTMPLFLAHYGRIGQNVRAGQGRGKLSLFVSDSSKAPPGLSPFTYTGRRSVPAGSVPTRAPSVLFRMRAGVGNFFEQNPAGVFTAHAPGSGPIEASTEKSPVRVGGELPLPGAFSKRGPETRSLGRVRTSASLPVRPLVWRTGCAPRGLTSPSRGYKRYGPERLDTNRKEDACSTARST